MVQPEYGKISRVENLKSQVKVKADCPFDLGDEVKKTISLTAQAFLLSDVNSNLTKKAKVVFCLVYLSEDGYKKVQTETEVSADCPEGYAVVSVCTRDVKLLNSNGNVGVATVVFNFEGKKEEERVILSGGNGIQVKTLDVLESKVYPYSRGKQTITDEFEIDFAVSEVLYYGANAYLNSVISGLGRIIVEGEAVLTVKALPIELNNDIIKERRVIPFRYEIEDENAFTDMDAFAFVSVSATNVKIYADESRGKSTVTADICLSFVGEVASKEKASLVLDAYAVGCNCELKRGQIELKSFGEQKLITEKVIREASSVEDGSRIITTLGEGLTVTSAEREGNGYAVEGIVKTDVVFRNADNGTSCEKVEIPFSISVNEREEISSLSLSLSNLNARIKNGVIELEVEIKLAYMSIISQKYDFIEEITQIEEKLDGDSAIFVYSPTEGDDLWEVAKTLKVREDEILRYNPELSFPLNGNERVVIYRQKI